MRIIIKLSQKYSEPLTIVNWKKKKIMFSYGFQFSFLYILHSIRTCRSSKGTRCCGLRSSFGFNHFDLQLMPLSQPRPASLKNKDLNFRGNEEMYLNGVFCSFHCSKDLRNLFVLKQVTSLLHLHITKLPGGTLQTWRPGWPSVVSLSHSCPASCLLIWFCF